MPSTLTNGSQASQSGRICIALFVVSACFPIAASVYPTDAPRWLGFADVGIAGLLVIATIGVAMRTQKRITDEDELAAFRFSRLLISVIPALLLFFFIAGQRINWNVLVIGLAWRGWLLLYSLPHLVAANRRGSASVR